METKTKRTERRAAVNLSNDLIEEMLARIPCCKSLFRLRVVCKQWLYLIDDPRFRCLWHKHQTAFLFFGCMSFEVVRFIGDQSHRSSIHRPSAVAVHDEQQHGASYYLPNATPSCHGLLCLYSIFTSQLMVWNPITGDTLDLERPPYPNYAALNDRAGSGYFPMVCLGFHPPTNKYKVVVMCGRHCQVLTLGGGGGRISSWRTFEAITEFHRLWFATCNFCYNGVLYWLISSDLRSSHDSALITFDLGSEEVRVHYGFQGHPNSGGRSSSSSSSRSIKIDLSKICQKDDRYELSQILWFGNSGKTADVCVMKGRDMNWISFCKVFSFEIKQGIETSTAPTAAPLCIHMGQTLVCDEQGFQLYHDLLERSRTLEDLIGKLSKSSSLGPVSLHADTFIKLKNLH